MIVHALFKFAANPYGGVEVDTTASSGVFRGLSPFVLGPIKAFAGAEAQNFENFWQFSKVYKVHIGLSGDPSLEWLDWRREGFNTRHAIRYPMGKGAVPEYTFWHGEKLGYVEARKRIYAPIYAEYVQRTESFSKLKEIYDSAEVLVLRDYDAYDHLKLGMSLKDVINNPNRKMGHAFVLMMILVGELEFCLQDNKLIGAGAKGAAQWWALDSNKKEEET